MAGLLTGELVSANRVRLAGAQCAKIARRAISLLPAGHGPVSLPIDCADYQL